MRRRPASIKWYHEIFRKYAEGVTGLKPRVKRSGTLGTEYECFYGTTGGSMSINRVGKVGPDLPEAQIRELFNRQLADFLLNQVQ